MSVTEEDLVVPETVTERIMLAARRELDRYRDDLDTDESLAGVTIEVKMNTKSKHPRFVRTVIVHRTSESHSR